jgi:hypothetical protein
LKNFPLAYGPLVRELQRSYKWFHFIDSTWLVLRYDTLGL